MFEYNSFVCIQYKVTFPGFRKLGDAYVSPETPGTGIVSFVASTIQLSSMVRCTTPGCRFVAAYSSPPRPPTHCVCHKQEGMSRSEPPRANKNSSTQQEITQQRLPLASIFRATDDS